MAVKKKKSVKKSKGTRKSSLKKKRENKGIFNLLSLGKRIVLGVVVFVLLAWAGVWFFLSGSNTHTANFVSEKALTFTRNAGFKVENILVEGRKYSDPEILLSVVNVIKGDPILSLNPEEAKKQIERISWVKSARVERRLPDTIYIELQEYRPLALWRNDNTLSVIASDGVILTQSNLVQFKDLLMIVGKGAPKKAEAFIEVLDSEPDLKKLIDRAEIIDERRWNLYCKDGKLIKLPAADAGLAIRNVMLRHEQDNILSKDTITVIDARYKGRLIVRTKLGGVQDYKSSLKNVGTNL